MWKLWRRLMYVDNGTQRFLSPMERATHTRNPCRSAEIKANYKTCIRGPCLTALSPRKTTQNHENLRIQFFRWTRKVFVLPQDRRIERRGPGASEHPESIKVWLQPCAANSVLSFARSQRTKMNSQRTKKSSRRKVATILLWIPGARKRPILVAPFCDPKAKRSFTQPATKFKTCTF